MDLPIIFIHQGYSEYLHYSLLQAKLASLNHNIILISDDMNIFYHFTQYEKLQDYLDGANFLASIYKHFNRNDFQYTLFNIQRWFILRDFMFNKNINRCVYLDSDVMLYANFHEMELNHIQMGTAGGSGHTCIINDRKTLDDFCKFIIDYYCSEKQIVYLQQLYESKSIGGIGDMTLFFHYREKYPEKIQNLCEVDSKYTVFDHNLNWLENYESDDRKKKVYLFKGKPYCKHYLFNMLISFHSLHFQGDAKQYMRFFLQPPSEYNSDLLEFNYKNKNWISSTFSKLR